MTLEDLAAMVKAGEDFVVYDAKTGEDITRSVLAQIIFEQENKEGAQNLLPINFLRQLIRFYGDSMQMLVPRYLEASIESLTREQEKFRQQMTQAFGMGAFGPLEDQVRRNMEMFERAFAMFTPFAKREAKTETDKTAASGRRQRRRRDRRAQAPDGRDAEAARAAWEERVSGLRFRGAMPRRKFAWASLPDEQLLRLRLKDLKVTVEGTWLEDCLSNLHDELEERGIRVRPHAWISSEWFSPENTARHCDPVLSRPPPPDASSRRK